MQMSKQEKIIVFVLLILVVLGIGIFVFILPNYSNIEINQKALDNVNSQYSEILSRLERENTIDDDIKTAYDVGKTLADAFYDDLTPVEADEIMRQFIAKGNNIRISELKVGPMATENLSISVIVPGSVTYPLKNFANTVITGSGTESVDLSTMSERERFNYAKQLFASLLSISEPVTVGVSTVSFTAYADELQDLYDLADILNEGIYDETIVDEDGNPQKKATYLNGAKFELSDKSSAILTSAFADVNGGTAPSEQEVTTESAEESNTSSQDENSAWGKYKMDFTVKLYCIEPVADPFGNN
ncbi:MAG: hypothetical protein J1E39_04435 [Eubacterium sp.]|nr:hypothetical protein [Eubacterium sp.]